MSKREKKMSGLVHIVSSLSLSDLLPSFWTLNTHNMTNWFMRNLLFTIENLIKQTGMEVVWIPTVFIKWKRIYIKAAFNEPRCCKKRRKSDGPWGGPILALTTLFLTDCTICVVWIAHISNECMWLLLRMQRRPSWRGLWALVLGYRDSQRLLL